VRTISAEIRGDVSHEDVLLLNKMDAISITHRDLDYGINPDDMFWVDHGILLRDDIRDSRDEEMVADLISYIVSAEDDKPSSSRRTRDLLYGRRKDSSAEAQQRATDRKQEIDLQVSRHGPAVIQKTFLSTIDVIDQILPEPGDFRRLLKNVSGNYGTPRYFQSVFLAFYELLYVDKLKVADAVGIKTALDRLDDHVKITTGGDWGSTNRVKNVAVVKGLTKKFFKKNPNDPVATIGKREFVNLLSKSKTEAASYEFKQGLHRLEGKMQFDDGAFTGVLETICALANLGKDKVGYVVLGVADKKADADQVKKLYRVASKKAGAFHVVGVDREATKFHTNMDKYLQFLADKISRSELSEETRLRVTSQLSALDYEGLSSIVIRVEAGGEPCFLGEKMFRRKGAQTVVVPGKEIIQIVRLFQ
jgi:hypothetical protein